MNMRRIYITFIMVFTFMFGIGLTMYQCLSAIAGAMRSAPKAAHTAIVPSRRIVTVKIIINVVLYPYNFSLVERRIRKC